MIENGWTLHVEDFGRIERADVTISPLTFFVGDNNSGKSYLMALIYGLLQADDVLGDLLDNSEEYKICAKWTQNALQTAVEDRKVTVPFDYSAYHIFENLLNRILEDRKQEILSSLLTKTVSAGKISVTFPPGENDSLTIRLWQSSLIVSPSFYVGDYVLNLRSDISAQMVIRTVHYILVSMLRRDFPVLSGDGPCFLPTVRTGLLLVYLSLAGKLFKGLGPDKSEYTHITLTKPVADFLGFLLSVRQDEDENFSYRKIVPFIEAHIIDGQIHVSNELPIPEFFYQSNQINTRLPMFLSSDVVRETTPLILALKYRTIGALLIEEPELNLHPALQHQMSRVLIKLVNAGLPVIAATHSDTILQHVNNMVKMSRLSEERKKTLMDRYGFDADDPIPAEKVSMYEFDVQKNKRTTVRRLSCGDYGFEVPTFFDPLESLLDQSRDTELDAEEYENE